MTWLALKGALGLVPRWIWEVLAAALMWHMAVAWHAHQIKAHDAKITAAEDARIATEALKLKDKIDGLTAKISEALRSKNDAENNRISSAADAIRVRGPGRAACTSNASMASAAGGHEPASGQGNAPMGKLPYPDGQQLIGMPFAGTVNAAENHDANRAEALSWREWWTKQASAHKPVPVPPKKRTLWQRITPW